MIKIKSFVFNPFMENTYLLYDDSSECLVVDPGCYEPHEQQELQAFIEDNNLKPVLLLNTHCHIDHVLGNFFIKTQFGLNLAIHSLEEPLLRAVNTYASNYGFYQYQESKADQYLEEGNLITFGNSSLEIAFVPGHSPGHLAFFNKEQNICIGGDVLFLDSIGRTDLPGGNYDTLIHSIHTKIFPLGDDMKVYPGHGSSTTVGAEKRSNPFCALSSNEIS